MSFPITIESHCGTWDEDFRRERSRIESALGPGLKALHHVGSTAVAGLPAKPVIDMLAEIESFELVDARREGMELLGYEAMGEFGIPGRRYFRKNNRAGIRTHHLHAFLAGSRDIVRHLAFRDFLRSHPDVAAEYGALKIRLVESCQGDWEAYVEGKSSFVKALEQQALQWMANAPGEPPPAPKRAVKRKPSNAATPPHRAP